MKIVENTKQKWKSQNKSLWLKGLFRDSQTPSWLSEFRTDVPGELPAPKTKDYNMDISHFSAKHATLKSENKELLLGIRIMCPMLFVPVERHVFSESG
jgi:hypothetical protein